MGVFNGLISSTLGMWRGTQIRNVALSGERPELQPLHLYDMESCPFCRLVREAMTELDLDVVIYPCPKGGERFRGRVMELGGKEQFPFLVDPNNDRSLYESWDILRYLFIHYGGGEVPDIWRFRHLNLLSAVAGNLVRLGAGGFVWWKSADEKWHPVNNVVRSNIPVIYSHVLTIVYVNSSGFPLAEYDVSSNHEGNEERQCYANDRSKYRSLLS